MKNRIRTFVEQITERQRDMLLWAFDGNGWVDPEMFLTICEHEHVDYSALPDPDKINLLQSLAMTAFLKACTY